MSTPSTPNIAAARLERPAAVTAGVDSPMRRLVPIISMAAGVLVVIGAVVYLMAKRQPESTVVDLAAAFACPPGVEARSGRMQVTAKTLNVRTAPSAKAERLPDRTLRKNAAVAEECRAAGWSRVRLVDGRSGWVANQYLASISSKN